MKKKIVKKYIREILSKVQIISFKKTVLKKYRCAKIHTILHASYHSINHKIVHPKSTREIYFDTQSCIGFN